MFTRYLVFFFLLSNISFSQVQISGYIQESGSGERLPYSNIYLDDLQLGVSANENGFFSFDTNSVCTLVVEAPPPCGLGFF